MDKASAEQVSKRLERLIAQCEAALMLMADRRERIRPGLVAETAMVLQALRVSRDALLVYLKAIDAGFPLDGFDDYLVSTREIERHAGESIKRIGAEIAALDKRSRAT